MKNKKIHITVILSFLLVVVATLVGFGLNQKNNKIENQDVRIEKFEKYVPKNDYDFNFELAKNKGYSPSKQHVTSEYLDLQSKYDQVLSIFLEEKLSIMQLDTQLDSLELIKVPKTSISKVNSTDSYYRNNSHLNSEYLYLRNNIKIERLKKSDVEILKNLDLSYSTDKEKLIEMVSRTYVDVLRVALPFLNEKQQKEDYQVGYTNDGKEFVDKNAIVFWLNIPTEFDDTGDFVNRDKGIENEEKAEKLAKEYSLLFSKESNREVRIFVRS